MTIDVDGSSGVNIDGAIVKLNCPPAVPHKHWSLQPLKKERDQKSEGGETKKKRAKRARWAAAAPSSAQSKPSQKQAWIEIELVDEQGNPRPNERYLIKLPDGSIREGRLDINGRARIDGIEPGTALICFPDIDATDWRPY
jgi:hypothetical protein